MSAAAAKAPKKEKPKKQTPEERAKLMRYNQMMYGPTAGELRPATKKVNYGASYLTHPKFISLMAAFRKGAAYRFEVTDKTKTFTIATEDANILFDGRVIFYSRHLNKYEENLLIDREAVLQFQTTDALVHLVFAVIRHFPELGPVPFAYMSQQFYQGADTLDVGIAAQGPNLLIGSYRHGKVQEKPRA
jgi:hypothetical protein